MHRASNEQQHAEHDFDHRQIIAWCAIRPRSRDAFGEIQPHHEADPAVGVHAVFEEAGERDAQRQHFEGEPTAAWADRGKEELPSEAQRNEAK